MTDAVAVTVVTVLGGVMTTFLRLIFKRLGSVRDKQERDTEHLSAKLDSVHESIVDTTSRPVPVRQADVSVKDRTRRNSP